MCRRWQGRGCILAEAIPIRIGEVARLTGVPAKTLRYYEDVGLLGPADRTASGYRVYGGRELEQIAFVRRAKLMGLSLEEIRGLVQIVDEGIPGGVFQRLDRLLDEKLEETEREMEELRAFRESLLEYRERVSEADERGSCRCAQLDPDAYCGCVTAATAGVQQAELGVVRENGKSLQGTGAGEGCRCGCC